MLAIFLNATAVLIDDLMDAVFMGSVLPGTVGIMGSVTELFASS